MTILSIVAVASVYAVWLGSFTGGQVTVGLMGSGNVMYSDANAEAGPWVSTLEPTDATWYSRLELAGGYSGPVTITWELQKKDATWADVAGANATTTMVLTGGAQNVYATSDGVYAVGQHDWGSDVATDGAYRVFITVESA